MDIKNTTLSTRVKNRLVVNGIISVDDLADKTIEDIKGFGGMGNLSILELKEYLLLHHKIKLKNKPKPKDPTVPLKRKIIEKFIKVSLHNNPDSSTRSRVWADGMRVTKTLVKRYPEEEFWEKFDLGFKLNSLFYLLGQGKPKVESAYAKWKNFDNLVEKVKEDTVETAALEEMKQGEDYKPKSKPIKNLKDFLNA